MTMKSLRVATLATLIMVLVAGGLPAAVSLAKWGRRPGAVERKKQRHYRKYSRAWWRRQRARQRARRARALARRRRIEALRSAATQAAEASPAAYTPARPEVPAPLPNAALSSPPPLNLGGAREAGLDRASAPRMPFEYAAPASWRAARRSGPNAVQFTLRSPSGQPAGTATLAPVALPRDAGDTPVALKKSIGGVSVASLRRTVIDRMVAEGGWVTNDYVREIDGRRVFVVVAQTGAPGSPTESQTFYFTEVDGRVYSLATSAPLYLAEPVAAGSEQLMSSLRPAGRGNLVLQK